MQTRRRFVAQSLVAVAGVNAFLISQCKNLPTAVTKEMTTPVNLEEVTIEALQKMFNSGALTAESLTQTYLSRIEAIDRAGVKLNAIIEINPDALDIARQSDADRAAGQVRGPLHGIPILIKDNINTGDRMTTTAGALALVGNVAEKDAFIIERLRQSGAVLLGKTNLSEWANFRSTRSSSGWSSRGGQTKNPYVLDHSPCGSSSGSGAAVAANLCTIAIGTETDGSVACPASINGVVGIKPTVGLWSRSGIIPISHTQDTAGPMARTVRDAAILLGALAAKDAKDSATDLAPEQSIDYTAHLDQASMQNMRLGIDPSFLKKHEAIDALLSKTLDTLKDHGAAIVEVDYMGPNGKINDAEFTVLKYEFKYGVEKYLQNAKFKLRTLQDIIQFNNDHREEAMPFFGQELLEQCAELRDLSTKEYILALKDSHEKAKSTIDDLLQKNKLDALIGPATGASWCIDKVNGDHWTGYGAYGISAVAGYPSVTVPMGYIHELPIGMSFMGTAYDEENLIQLAYAFEQLTKARKSPKFLTHI